MFLNPGAATAVGAALYEELTEDEKLFTNFVADWGRASVSDISRLTGRDWRKSKSVLEALVVEKTLILESRSGKERESSKRYALRNGGKL